MKEWKRLLILTLVALAYRIAHFLLFANDLVVGNDQMQNILLAKNLASGNFYGVLDTYWPPVYPIMLGVLTYFVNSLMLPSVIISILAGSLAVPLTYCVVRQSYGRSQALIAGIIAIFYSHLINSVFRIGTENVYFLFIVGALILGWKCVTKNSAKYYLLTGIALGLGYLTRPEAVGYFALFALLIVIRALLERNLLSRLSMIRIGAFVLGFAILATPYVFYLRSEIGAWEISGKAARNLAAGSFERHEDDQFLTIGKKQPVVVLIKHLGWSLIPLQRSFSYLLPFLLMVFVGLGLFAEEWDKKRLRREAYLMLFCFLTILGYALTVIQTRYFFILLPVFFGWIACGILRLNQWFQKLSRGWVPERFSFLIGTNSIVALCIVFIFLYTLPLNFYMVSAEEKWRAYPYEERDAGIWLKKHGKQLPVIFSGSRKPIFYAEGRPLVVKTKNLDLILSVIKTRRADYVVTSERSLKRNPYLEGLPKALIADPHFKLVYRKRERKGYKISIFELK